MLLHSFDFDVRNSLYNTVCFWRFSEEKTISNLRAVVTKVVPLIKTFLLPQASPLLVKRARRFLSLKFRIRKVICDLCPIYSSTYGIFVTVRKSTQFSTTFIKHVFPSEQLYFLSKFVVNRKVSTQSALRHRHVSGQSQQSTEDRQFCRKTLNLRSITTLYWFGQILQIKYFWKAYDT